MLTCTGAPPEECAKFESWKDPRSYNAVLKACQPCNARGRRVVLSSRAKALNHWAANGSGKDPTATIKDCLCSSMVPGLVAYAREQIALKKQQRQLKGDLEQQQREKDAADAAHREVRDQSNVTMASAGSLRTPGECSVSKRARSGSVAEQLDFTNRWVTMLDRTVANWWCGCSRLLLLNLA